MTMPCRRPPRPAAAERTQSDLSPGLARARRAEGAAGGHGRRAHRDPAGHRRQEIRTGNTAQAVMPHKHGHVLGTWHKASARKCGRPFSRGAQRPSRLGQLAVGGSRRGVPPRRRAADDDVAADAQRRDDARPVEDGVSGRDRRGVRADRLLALQRRLRPGALSRSSRSARHGAWNQSDYRALEGSSTPSRRSTSRPSAATCRPRRR